MRIEFVMTWSMAVLWKNGAAPIVVPGIRVVIEISLLLDVREAICVLKGREKSDINFE